MYVYRRPRSFCEVIHGEVIGCWPSNANFRKVGAVIAALEGGRGHAGGRLNHHKDVRGVLEQELVGLGLGDNGTPPD